jgi:PadR family transcriptional regulator PadR
LFIEVVDETTMDFDRELITGTVTVLILSLLSEREMYGYEILQEAERRSAHEFQLKEGTLYPALHNLEQSGLLKAVWRAGDSGPRRKYYSLTAKGRRHAHAKRRQWETLASLMRTILGGANG